jgi:acetyl-CoA C-acetyltransferase/acetyl-CoA acyltransferase
MREVVVLGVGMTQFGVSTKTNMEMFSEAAMEAIETSNIDLNEIQALFVGNVLGDFEEGQMNMAPFLAAELGLPFEVPATRFEGACATATVAIRNAALMVATGVHDLVLVGGTERAAVMGTSLATRTFAMGSHCRFEEPAGITFPGVFGMAAHMYSRKYGIPLATLKEAMANVAIKNHRNARFNSKAHFPMSIEDIMERRRKKAQKEGKEVPQWADEMAFLKDLSVNPMIADPLQLYDCCPFSDGAAALVMGAAEKYKDRVKVPVYIAGTGQGSAGGLYLQRDLTRVRAREASVKQAYSQAGIGPQDVDVCELHDCFTIAEILAMEGLGLCEFGKACQAIEKGETQLGGRIPINPSGGLKAKGHPIGATGAAQAYEIVKQLRGECGERQVDGARIGLIDTLGGDFGTLCHIIFRR